MEFTTITAAISGAKGLYDMARGISSQTTDYAVKDRTADLAEKLLSLYSELFKIKTAMAELYDAKVKVEKELERIHAWDSEVVPKYRMVALADGVFAYAYSEHTKLEGADVEPVHYLCSRCFGERRKGLLQRQGYEIGGMIYKCEVCGNTVCNHADKPPSWGPTRVPKTNRFQGY